MTYPATPCRKIPLSEMIAVMQAFERGEPIHGRPRSGLVQYEWRDCPNPRWDWFASDYRTALPGAML